MLYIVTEDSNSARTFWSKAAETYRKAGTYTLVPLLSGGGNTTLKGQITNVFKVIKPGDSLFVVFDNIDKVHNFDKHDLIKMTSKRCINKNIKFTYTTYYCFEEIYLSYRSLLPMVNDKYNEVLKFVADCINSGKEYFDKLNPDSRILDFLDSIKHPFVNKEHFADDLLTFATQTTKGSGWFRIHKSANAFDTSGRCWLYGCEEVSDRLGQQERANVCDNKCKFDCKNCNTKDKLEHLNNNSLLANW